MFGTITERFAELSGNELYFAMARGNKNARDIKITKWFKTNHYYIVPKLSFDSKFSLNPSKILAEFKEAKKARYHTKNQYNRPYYLFST